MKRKMKIKKSKIKNMLRRSRRRRNRTLDKESTFLIQNSVLCDTNLYLHSLYFLYVLTIHNKLLIYIAFDGFLR
jgi:hypothetical protein